MVVVQAAGTAVEAVGVLGSIGIGFPHGETGLLKEGRRRRGEVEAIGVTFKVSIGQTALCRVSIGVLVLPDGGAGAGAGGQTGVVQPGQVFTQTFRRTEAAARG